MKVTDHPGGFLKIVLWEKPDGSSRRIHAWEDHLPDTMDIHQHRGDITESTVLEGSGNHEIWRYEDDPAGGWDRMTVRCWTGEDGQYRVDEVAPRVRCRPVVAELRTLKAGDTYSLDAAVLHRIFPVRLPLVTVVTFGPAYQEVHTILRVRQA